MSIYKQCIEKLEQTCFCHIQAYLQDIFLEAKVLGQKEIHLQFWFVIPKLNSFQCRKQNHSRHFKQEGTCREFEASKVIGRVKGIGCRDLGWASRNESVKIQNWFTRGSFYFWDHHWAMLESRGHNHNLSNLGNWERSHNHHSGICQIMKLLPPPSLLHILKLEDGHLITAAWQQVSHNIATFKNLKKMAYVSPLFSTYGENIELRKI